MDEIVVLMNCESSFYVVTLLRSLFRLVCVMFPRFLFPILFPSFLCCSNICIAFVFVGLEYLDFDVNSFFVFFLLAI